MVPHRDFPDWWVYHTWNDRPLQRYIMFWCWSDIQYFSVNIENMGTGFTATGIFIFLILAALTKDKELSATDQFAKLID